MKNKSIYIIAMIRSSMISLLLLMIMFKNESIMAKMMILPFLLCALCSIGKNIGFMLEKKKISILFDQLFKIIFLIFWFGFLIYSSYFCLISKNYIYLFMTLPFWIGGLYFTRKCFFHHVVKEKQDQKKSKFSMQAVVPVFLVFSVLLVGMGCLYLGIRDTYRLSKQTKGYLVTVGHYKDDEIDHVNQDGKTFYKLIYVYEVDEKEYMLTTDYSVGIEFLPEVGSPREIKYHPSDPTQAILSGTNRNNSLIYFGLFFILGGSVFVVAFLYIKGLFDKVKFNVMGAYIGMVCSVIGIGILLFQYGSTGSLSETVKTMKIFIVVPVLLILSGFYLALKSLFFEKENKKINEKKGR